MLRLIVQLFIFCNPPGDHAPCAQVFRDTCVGQGGRGSGPRGSVADLGDIVHNVALLLPQRGGHGQHAFGEPAPAGTLVLVIWFVWDRGEAEKAETGPRRSIAFLRQPGFLSDLEEIRGFPRSPHGEFGFSATLATKTLVSRYSPTLLPFPFRAPPKLTKEQSFGPPSVLHPASTLRSERCLGLRLRPDKNAYVPPCGTHAVETQAFHQIPFPVRVISHIYHLPHHAGDPTKCSGGPCQNEVGRWGVRL